MRILPAGRGFRIRLIFAMLAVFSSWNTAATMSDGNWIIFFREAEPSGFIIMVDQAISSGRRTPRHSVCHELRFHFAPHQLAEHGMPYTEAQSLFQAFEAELDNVLRDGKGEIVARRTGQNTRSVWFCAQDDAASAAQALIQAPRAIAIDLRSAPLAAIKMLHPTQLEGRLARDYDVVYSLAEQGDVHTIPRKIDHFIYDVSTGNRGTMEERLRKLGFEIEPRQRPDAILFFRVSPIDIDAIQNDTRHLIDLCAEFGCDYDGWGSPVMRR